jgi:hypothetical protein
MKTINVSESVERKADQFKTIREAASSEIPSEVLARLVEEVRTEEFENISAYSRFHNRHNRSR